MDLRPYIRSPGQIEEAKGLVIRGLLNYQPFIVAEDLEVGAGYEFHGGGEHAGMVYWPTIPEPHRSDPAVSKFLVNPARKAEFSRANQELRVLYDSHIDKICRYFGDIRGLTFAEIGCNAGYFPVSFSRRGAREAVGYDRGDVSDVFKWLNGVLGTRAKFFNRAYDPRLQRVPDCGSYDVVLSCTVLLHMSDPLQHLAFLGSIARKALFVFTPILDDDSLSIRFGEPNTYYKDDPFPFCFDNNVRPTRKLLRRSLELMGFTKIQEFDNPPEGMPVAENATFFAVRGD